MIVLAAARALFGNAATLRLMQLTPDRYVPCSSHCFMTSSGHTTVIRTLLAQITQVKGDGVLTFTELKNFFRGNEELSTYFISNIDLYSEEKKRKGSHDDSSDSSDDELEASLTAVPKGDGVITLAEWFVCARSFGRWSLVVYGLTGYLVGPGTLSLTFCWLKVKSRRCVLSQSLSST